MPIFSLDVEKHVIGGLINNPKVFSDIATFVSEKDFFNEVHSVIYCVIRDLLSNGTRTEIDKVIVSEKIKNLGITFKDDIDVYDYIDSICYTKITPEGVIDNCQELIKIRIRREGEETADKLKAFVKTNGNLGIDGLVSGMDTIYNDKISKIIVSDEIINIFDNIEEFIEERGNNQIEDVGFLTPYKEFNAMYGGLRPKNLYAFVARPQNGKSTLLSDLSFKTSLLTNFNIKTLFLDTEMETEDIKWRMVSSLSGVPMYFLETGKWRNSAEMEKTVRAAIQRIKNFKFDHLKVGNKSIDQICSLTKRWYYSKVGRGNKAIVVYDYIKLTGEKISNDWKEHQVIGEKVDKLKKLAEEINCPILVAMQMNRMGENQNKKSGDLADDSSAIASSDRLQWFASFVGIFRRKIIEEIAEDGIDSGTHKLIPTKTRFQGRDAAGHQDIIKRKFSDGTEKYVSNYINFDVKNFNVEEKGSLRTVLLSSEPKVKETNPEDGDTCLDFS